MLSPADNGSDVIQLHWHNLNGREILTDSPTKGAGNVYEPQGMNYVAVSPDQTIIAYRLVPWHELLTERPDLIEKGGVWAKRVKTD